MSDTIIIGAWAFSPATGQLCRGDETHRLEKRTAALLEFLCRSDGQLVSHSEIIEAVWDGRSVSPNSVAVVIADIRRAMSDEARNPSYIETLPKRGYRMIAPIELVAPVGVPMRVEGSTGSGFQWFRRKRWTVLAALASILAIVALSAHFLSRTRNHPPLTLVTVTPIENETNDQQYIALAPAISELVSVELMRHDGLQVSSATDANMIVSGRVILWNGHAAVSLHAKFTSNGRTFWSGMASGPETDLPRQVRREIADFAAEASKRVREAQSQTPVDEPS